MYTVTNLVDNVKSDTIAEFISLDNTFFFDIETTGFSRQHNICYLIGVLYFKDNNTFYTQWFCENKDDEENVLNTFINFANNYNKIIHFNGDSFDIPFLEARIKKYGIDFNFDNYDHLDLYKAAKNCKPFLKLDNYRQKNIEKFLGIDRKDICSGKELIDIYNDYINSHDENMLNTLLLHNHDDIIGLAEIISIISYENVLNGAFSYNRDEVNENEAVIKYSLRNAVPVPVHLIKNDIHILIIKDVISVVIPIISGTLKHFYGNYRDYYYIPAENKAIHKSVAAYVDSGSRQKCTPANCYTGFSGRFIIKPSCFEVNTFKYSYEDALEYMLIDDVISKNGSLDLYAREIIKEIAIKK